MKLRTALALSLALACSTLAPAMAGHTSIVGPLFNDATWYPSAVGGSEMNINEVELGPDADRFFDGYDGAWYLSVDGFSYAAPSYAVSGTTVTGSPVSMSGVNVSMQYYFAPLSSVARILVTIQNPGEGAASPNVRFFTNLGSDGSTVVQSTSSGDAVVTPADRWFVSTEGLLPRFGDPIITTVTHGPGTPRVMPSVSQLPSGRDSVTTEFVMSVPAGQTRHLMLFAGLGGITVADNLLPSAQAGAALFNSTSTLRPEWLSGMSATQQSQVVNWVLETFTTCAAEGFTGAKLTLCRSICEVDQPSSTLINRIKLYTAIYRQVPPCGL